MAENMYKKYTERKTRRWNVGTNVLGGSLVINAESDEVGVTIADSGGTSRTSTDEGLRGNITSVTYKSAGVGYDEGIAEVARDGSWLFAVAGVTDGETTGTTATGTDQGTPVYAEITAGKVTGLTLTATDNTKVGQIDDCYIVDGVAAIEIGVGA